MISQASATWSGSWHEGRGALSTGSDAAKDLPFSYASRFEGASGGIGYELAKLFARDKYNLVLVSRGKEKLQQRAEEMRKLGNTTMRDWAGAAQERVAEALHEQEPTLRSRKKKR